MTTTYYPLTRVVCLYLLLSIASTISPSLCRAEDTMKAVSSLRGGSSSAIFTRETTTQYGDDINNSIQHHDQYHHRILQRPEHPCLLVRVELEYGQIKANGVVIDETFIDDASSLGPSQEVQCELSDVDVDMAGQYFVPILGIDDADFVDIVSGETTLLADGAAFFDGALQIPADAAIEFGTVDDNDERKLRRQQRERQQQQQQEVDEHRQRQLATVGTRKLLAIRVIGEDVSTTASSDLISDNIFGTNGDTTTMAAQFEQCSHGKLLFQPFTGRTTTGVMIQKGVVDITIPNIVTGADRRTIEHAVQFAAKDRVGDLRQFDHVMLCLPPGSSGNKWIAYAYVNSWLTVFNDDWCRMLSTQVHEMGHNLGLAHSGSQGVSYGDKSGMMGYSYFQLDKPLQCYNPAKSFELGWYEDKSVTWDPLTQGTWFGTLVGVVDYKRNNNSGGSNYNTVIVKIDRGGNDLYIGYNRKKGANSGVVANGDQVTIVEEESGYSESSFLIGLGANYVKMFYDFKNSGKTLTVKFMETRSNSDEAFVAIYLDDCIYPSCCSGELCQTQPPIVITQPPIVITPILDKVIKDSPFGHPVLIEVLPNPTKQKSEYIELYNPTSKPINLSNYQVCVMNGNNGNSCLPITGITWLGMGEFFMLCRDEGYIRSSGLLEKLARVCHQDAENFFKISNRKTTISLQLIGSNNVDKIFIKNSSLNRNEVYARRNGCNDEKSNKCWEFTQPAGAAAWDDDDNAISTPLLFAEEAVVEKTAAGNDGDDDYDDYDYDDDGILSAGDGIDIAIQSLPPIDFGGDEMYTIGESIGDFWGNETTSSVMIETDNDNL